MFKSAVQQPKKFKLFFPFRRYSYFLSSLIGVLMFFDMSTFPQPMPGGERSCCNMIRYFIVCSTSTKAANDISSDFLIETVKLNKTVEYIFPIDKNNWLHFSHSGKIVGITEYAKWTSALTSKSINFLVDSQAVIKTVYSAYTKPHWVSYPFLEAMN